jgi:hypothetical protein
MMLFASRATLLSPASVMIDKARSEHRYRSRSGNPVIARSGMAQKRD